MAFNLKSIPSVINDYLVGNDLTGNYNVNTNPGGWGGGSNPNKADITSIEIVLYNLSQGDYFYSANPAVHAMQGLESAPYEYIVTWQAVPFPSSLISVPFTTDEFPNGIYYAETVVTATTFGIIEYRSPKYFAKLTDIDCCIEKMAVNLCGCGGKKEYSRYIELKELRKSMDYRVDCINNTMIGFQGAQGVTSELYTRDKSYYQDLLDMYAQMQQLCKEGGCDAC